MTLSDFINNQLSFENYSFTFDEIADAYSGKSEDSVQNDLKYATKNGNIIPLRHHFYLIIPPRYSRLGKLPLELYVNSLFKYLDRNYYVGLYSAAKFYGAGHQQIQKEYVLHNKAPLLSILKSAIHIDFFTVSNWPRKNIISRKGDAGMFNISSPCLTAVDLIYHQTKIGGLNRMLSVIEELTEEIKLEDAQDLLSWYSQKSVLQRLGFLLDEINPKSEIANLIHEHLKYKKFYPVLLSPRSNEKAGAVENRWKIDVNVKMESDL
ncbi:type IV toxin-antitoxin system AbiEi family antitoxin [uncultured Marixanthomonas sp.]|uniref:type IV toxin-antitoxin system AbiEi family antitoxin n=1 Tax=uncultured Marixanthomonas sp. TaxID=757245 RepID=UPI0030DC0C79